MAKRQATSPQIPRKRHSPSSTPTHTHNETHNSLANYIAAATDSWITCGKCATTLGLVSSAIKSYESALGHDPANATALCGLTASLRASDIAINETIGSQRAIEILTKSLDQYGHLAKEAAVYKELAECQLLVGMNEQAHQTIEAALGLTPEDPSLWLLSGQALVRAGIRAHATTSLKTCLFKLTETNANLTTAEIDLSRAAHAELAAIAAAEGNIELTIHELTATLSLPPPPISRIDEHAALWCALATARERAGDIPGAIEACDTAERALGDYPRILMTHAYLLLLDDTTTNNPETAVYLLEKVIGVERYQTGSEEPSNEGDFLPWYLLGKAYSLLESPRAAYDSYQIALRRAPTSPVTWLAVGALYLHLSQLPDALAAYSQAARLQNEESSPASAAAWDGLACVYERCDDQAHDAADACTRSASCSRAIGDAKSANQSDQRAHALAAAARSEAPAPPLRGPPDVPVALLRDLVALMPSERIEYLQKQPQQPAGQTPQQSQPPQLHQQQTAPPQQQQLPRLPQMPPQAGYISQQAQQPFHAPFPQQKAKTVSPRVEQHPMQQQQQPIQRPWSPNHHPHPPPQQYYYTTSTGSMQAPPPPNGQLQQLPPPGHSPTQSMQQHPPPPPPGYGYGPFIPVPVQNYGPGPAWR